MLNLTTGNPSLARVKSIRSPRKYANITVGMLSPGDKKDLLAISKVIFAEELLDTDCAVTAQFDESHNFKRSYPPSVYQLEGKLVIKFGNRTLTFAENFGNADVRIAEVTLEKYDDVTLVITYEVEEDNYVELPLPLKMTKESLEQNNLAKLNGWLKKGQLDKLASCLLEAKVGGGTAGGPAMVDLSTLTEFAPIRVLSSKTVNASYGISYILTVQDGEAEPVTIWAPYTVKELLNLGATVSDNTTLTFQNYTNKNGMLKQSVQIENLEWPVTEESASIDMSIFN